MPNSSFLFKTARFNYRFDSLVEPQKKGACFSISPFISFIRNRIQQRMQCTIFLLLACILSACAHPPKPRVVEGLSPPAFRAPSLEPGCLLPSPEVINSASAGSIELLIDVSAAGRASKAKIIKSSGRADRDIAFQQAGMNCIFLPANTYSRSTGEHKAIDGQFSQLYSWGAQEQFTGPARCFMPSYPRQALILEEQANVNVYFRRVEANGTFDYRVMSRPVSRILQQASLMAAQHCLDHAEAQVGLLIGSWYEVPFRWELGYE